MGGHSVQLSGIWGLTDATMAYSVLTFEYMSSLLYVVKVLVSQDRPQQGMIVGLCNPMPSALAIQTELLDSSAMYLGSA